MSQLCMPDDRIYINGINARSGQYLVRPKTIAEAAELARANLPAQEQVNWFQRLVDRFKGRFFGLPMDVEPTDLAQAGWSVVLPSGIPDAVKRAVQPLIEHRSRQVPPDRWKILDYTPRETWEDWLARHGVHGSDIEPTMVPYYVLLVGGPEEIPFEFQYQLDVNYAVGRIAFDVAEDYRKYAEAVIAYEQVGAIPNSREVVYWGTRHEGDPATELSSEYLIKPLAEGERANGTSPGKPPVAANSKFRSRVLRDNDATKANLLDVLHTRAKATTSVLFTASHGMGWPIGDKEQRLANGALLCQDWTGFGRIHPEHYLTAAEIEPDAQLHGLLAFLFACYGAGTPRHDNFLLDLTSGPVEIAKAPFVARIPQRLLAGGALAVIGHVERAWGYSIQPPSVGPQLLPIRNLIGRILAGEPVGHSTRDFSERYATASVLLASKLNPMLPQAQRLTDAKLAWTWIERNDAQNYVVLGDPAVRLRVGDLK